MAEDMRYLVRIFNTDLPGDKALVYSLTNIEGIGKPLANAIVRVAGLDPEKKTGTISDKEVEKIEKVIEDLPGSGIPSWMLNRQKDYETGEDKHLFRGDLKFTQDNDVKRLQKIKSRRGLRHAWNLPMRGQRTKSNFRKNKTKASSAGKRRGGR